jgi:hypothetical protein
MESGPVTEVRLIRRVIFVTLMGYDIADVPVGIAVLVKVLGIRALANA